MTIVGSINPELSQHIHILLSGAAIMYGCGKAEIGLQQLHAIKAM
jgi:hypothetical protein